MKKFLPLFLAVINLISPLKAADQSVQSTINRMANELTATYRSKSPNAKRARLAILDLQASEDLNKQRISPALTDMITNEFVNKSDFIVLEREMFGKIMEEHKLMANFGDVSNAIKVGKVLGAEIVLLGSATQFKSDLRINLRLVNTETTEILSTSYAAMKTDEFSEATPANPKPNLFHGNQKTSEANKKSRHPDKLAVAVGWPSASIFYRHSTNWAVEPKITFGKDLSIYGGRVYFCTPTNSNHSLYISLEGDHVKFDQKSINGNGFLIGMALGTEIYILHKISIVFDMGPNYIDLNSGRTDLNGIEWVLNSGARLYLF